VNPVARKDLTFLAYRVVIPLLDSNFLTPKLIGRSTGIHPIWLLFSICATVSVLGTCGIFISVPMAVALSTVCRGALKKLNSD
jgi:predicted PurR-regulated permease PerM